MSVLPITRFPDQLLKRPTRLVEHVESAEVQRLIEAMIRTMRHHPRCVGLAAPQVGSNLRVAVMDATGHPKAKTTHGLLVLVNPRLDEEGDAVSSREGCLSVSDFTANVGRATRVRLQALDQAGKPYELRLQGFEAIVVQHEVDHLDGCLFLDRVANIKTDIFRRKTYL